MSRPEEGRNPEKRTVGRYEWSEPTDVEIAVARAVLDLQEQDLHALDVIIGYESSDTVEQTYGIVLNVSNGLKRLKVSGRMRVTVPFEVPEVGHVTRRVGLASDDMIPYHGILLMGSTPHRTPEYLEGRRLLVAGANTVLKENKMLLLRQPPSQ